MKFVEITPDPIYEKSIRERILSFQWNGTQDGYFAVWDKLPNVYSVSMFTADLSIITCEGIKYYAKPTDWVIMTYPGKYQVMQNEDFVKLYGEYLKNERRVTERSGDV